MSESRKAFIEAELNTQKCKNCKNIFSLEDLDKDYEGNLATYGDKYVCTVQCMPDTKKLTKVDKQH